MATKEEIIEKLKQVVDPELYIDVYTLGLIYDILVDNDVVNIRMTFTSVACPAGPQLVQEIKDKLASLPGVRETNVEIVFKPPWEPSEELRGMLGIG